eukprot:14539-Heterococcus_DN1.PRE.2
MQNSAIVRTSENQNEMNDKQNEMKKMLSTILSNQARFENLLLIPVAADLQQAPAATDNSSSLRQQLLTCDSIEHIRLDYNARAAIIASIHQYEVQPNQMIRLQGEHAIGSGSHAVIYKVLSTKHRQICAAKLESSISFAHVYTLLHKTARTYRRLL